MSSHHRPVPDTGRGVAESVERMVEMSEYIYEESLCHDMFGNPLKAGMLIQHEEIVRCGDCINGASDGTLCTLNSILKPVNVEPNGFCKWGENKAKYESCFSIGRISDGYHTFDELYYHRTALFACLISLLPEQKTFKSWRHADGSMYEGYFIAGFFTPEGWSTYHCESSWWPLFNCIEMDRAPEWDGHTPSDAIHRLMNDFLPKQEVCGEAVKENSNEEGNQR